MYKFILTLHVLAAVLIIGPFALAAFLGRQAIRRLDAEGTRTAARIMARFGIGSVLVALLGAGALGSSDRYTFRTPWVIISLTLWVITMGVATGYTVPAMRRAASLIDRSGKPVSGGGDATPTPDQTAGDLAATGGAGPEPAAAALGTPSGPDDHAAERRLDAAAGAIAGSGALVLLLLVVITILMVVRPFGR